VKCNVIVSEAELASKMKEAETMYGDIVEATQERTSRLEEALFVGENFQQSMLDAMQSLRSVHDNLLSQDTPGADPATIQEQLRELQVPVSCCCCCCRCCKLLLLL